MVCIKCLAKNLTLFEVHKNYLLECSNSYTLKDVPMNLWHHHKLMLKKFPLVNTKNQLASSLYKSKTWLLYMSCSIQPKIVLSLIWSRHWLHFWGMMYLHVSINGNTLIIILCFLPSFQDCHVLILLNHGPFNKC